VRVLVTGASGFVGRRLLPRLAAVGAEVVAVDREVDVACAAAVERAVAQAAPDAVVHLAALSFVPASFEAPADAFRVNFLGTRHVLEAVRARAPAARVLVVSSGQVYGSAAEGAPPFDESAPLRPASPYARAKAAADLVARAFGERGLDVVRARPFNHTGPGRPTHFAEASLARQVAEIALGRRPPRIRAGNLDAVRDFLDAEDVVEAYVRLLDRAVPARAYNVASGVGRGVREVLAALLALAGLREGDVAVEVDPALWRPADRAVGDASRLRAATGWAPAVAFEATLRGLFDAARAELAAA
jgi:GDP-4-dehydro-6-deoxy-D-mannose reductase